jgi:hypothetical protein
VKFLGALYLTWVLGTAALGAWIGSDVFFHLLLRTEAAQHSWLAAIMHVGLFGALFLQGLLLHLRVPSSALLGLGLLVIVGIIFAVLNFLM